MVAYDVFLEDCPARTTLGLVADTWSLITSVALGDESGKEAVCRLKADLGCAPLDAGDLAQARHLEAAAIIVLRQLFGGADTHSVSAWIGGSWTARGGRERLTADREAFSGALSSAPCPRNASNDPGRPR